MRSSSTRRVGVVATLAVGLPLLVLTGGAPAAHAAGTRPTDDLYLEAEATPVCRVNICVHYAQDGVNDVPSEDDGAGGAWKGYAGNGVPDYVDLISASLLPKAAAVFDDAGYLPPVGDGSLGGGTDQVDIYLAELGDVDGGASCTPEFVPEQDATWGHCVLDNDYSPAEYGTKLSRGANLALDVVHQYFHLVQWAYNSGRTWLEDASSSWVEDEVYTSYNRNRAYLAQGPLGTSWLPPDVTASRPHAADGAWLMLEHLSERHPAEEGGLPVVIRKIWENLAEQTGTYESIQVAHGIDGALAEVGFSSLDDAFFGFSLENLRPERYYSEGAAYPAKRPRGAATLTRTTRSRSYSSELPPLTSATYRFTRSSTLTGSWRLKLATVLTPSGSGGEVTVSVRLKVRNQEPVVRSPSSSSLTVTLPFSASVEYVDVTITHLEQPGWEDGLNDPDAPYKVTAAAVR